MYVPPTLRINENQKIENLCDEFLHVDETPEANVTGFCIGCKCIRKSVTCIARLLEGDEEVYSCVYKNKSIDKSSAVHAEMFMMYDTKLRDSFKHGQKLEIYLTFQPCHFSGGHYKHNNISCTESLLQFHEKVLAPFDIQVTIYFGYIYRAHWINAKYDPMIQNAINGIRLLQSKFTLKPLEHINVLYKFCDEQVQNQWDRGEFVELLLRRKELVNFMKHFFRKNFQCFSYKDAVTNGL